MSLWVSLFACALYACGSPKPETREWTEDVLLSPDRVIQVRRTVVFDESNSLAGDAYNAVEREATLSFTGDLAHLPVWKQPLMALVLYQDPSTREWIVVATTTSCDVWRSRGKPEPPYWEFRLADGGWQEMPLSDSSIGHPVNLLHRYQRRSEKNHVTISDRGRLEASSNIGREYREIVREQKVHCMR
ncbi:MAG TPA: hypothetical protein PKE27_15475 [Povalibacter sp.]|uniref:hypothetical protein n=1 Tax=Povalibacter sp. TaxID=1962978 RepID=UPI002CC02F73|nr:hypothetical protein [Povalibacter sp.]HMN45977.1 hypothetical protein [Povalibacter sp.]